MIEQANLIGRMAAALITRGVVLQPQPAPALAVEALRLEGFPNAVIAEHLDRAIAAARAYATPYRPGHAGAEHRGVADAA